MSTEPMSMQDEPNFRELLGAFGGNANVERRARAERRAAMKPDDKRRKKGAVRDTQLNVRVRRSVSELAREICKAESWSQADLIENAIEALAKEKGLLTDAKA
jgi:hypothetical protein